MIVRFPRAALHKDWGGSSACCFEQVELSGPVNGKAEWPSELKPVAWNDDGDMVRMKLGLYHSTHNVADGDVSRI